MRIKLFFVAILALLCMLFSGCAESEPKPLRVCVDIGYTGSSESVEDTFERMMEYVSDMGEVYGGPVDIELEVIPMLGDARESVLERVRTEVMAGGGPDIFLVSNKNPMTTGEDALFPVPEKAMQNGVFLPLDKYIEENAQFTDWRNQEQSIMAGGRTDRGQLIIPLSYTFPLTAFRKSEVVHNASKEMTWDDMLSDESGVMRAAGTWFHASSSDFEMWESPYLSYILGDLADYSTEKLLFTEDELLQRTKDVMDLKRRQEANEFAEVPDHFQHCINAGYDNFIEYNKRNAIKSHEDLTMIPLYSENGGVTATIVSYAAVNSNTKRAKDAFFVLDVLMSSTIQRTSAAFNTFLDFNAIPLQKDIMQDISGLRVQQWGFSDANFKEFCHVRDQITNVQFRNLLTQELDKMYYQCEAAYGDEEQMREIVSEAYKSMQRMLAE